MTMLLALSTAVALSGCVGTMGGSDDPCVGDGCEPSVDPDPNTGVRGRSSSGGQCCVWIDIDNTINTFGSIGYPFNPVPAHTLCSMLAKHPGLRATLLTARAQWLTFNLSEKECQGVLQPTQGVGFGTGEKAAWAKLEHMQAASGCSYHLLIDDNKKAARAELLASDVWNKLSQQQSWQSIDAFVGAPYEHVLPKVSWEQTEAEITAALNRCANSVPTAPVDDPPAPTEPPPGEADPPADPPATDPPAAPSCQGACGGQSAGGCYCDEKCTYNDDCCADYQQLCAPQQPVDAPAPSDPGAASCVGYCGDRAPSGCYCDALCSDNDDCCADFVATCGVPSSGGEPPPSASCAGYCGDVAPAGCYCDELCSDNGDCCSDYGALCL